MTKANRNASVQKTISIPFGQLNQILDYAEEKNLNTSVAISELVRLGFVYLRLLKDQERFKKAEKAEVEARGLVNVP